MESMESGSNNGGNANVVMNEDENKYLDQIRYILKNGDTVDDRTSVGTISVFGMHSVYSLRNGEKFRYDGFIYILL